MIPIPVSLTQNSTCESLTDADTVIVLMDHEGGSLGRNDDIDYSGGNAYSRLTTVVSAGTYYVLVECASGNNCNAPYEYALAIEPLEVLCGPGELTCSSDDTMLQLCGDTGVAFEDFAEDAVLAVEPGRGDVGDEEL